ncbi:hypothetical protein RND81_04G118000 [Saponaria officinalis]|uniref:Uncharacterized protein n=1 Tax=Saponaria officinalis TaxID=3572 RepID=A0AAW1LKB9_SAPOF
MAPSMICSLFLTDKLDMMSDLYALKKTDELRKALAHIFDSAQPPSPDLPSEESRVPEGIFDEEIMSRIFDASDEETKKSMAEACKQRASWFLLAGPRSYMEYETTLVKEETEFGITLRDGDIIVQETCKCREAATVEERLRIHRQRLVENGSDAESVGEN